jgi:hypothetical protein
MRARLAGIVVVPVLLIAGCAGSSVHGPQSSDIRSRLIGGTWARHLDEKLFFADGTYESHDRAHDQPTHGKWRLAGRTLSMTEGGKTTTHRIISVTATDLDMTFGNGSEGLHYDRSPE